MTGFFSRAELPVINAPTLSPRCGSCGLFRTAVTPKMPYSGKGKKGILLVAEAPGREEDQSGRQFVGKSGQYLEGELRKAGINMREDCWLTNAVICRPQNNDLTPHPNAVSHCRPNLLNALRELTPRIIIPMGAEAVKSLIGHTWKEDVGGITRWAGFRIPDQKLNSWVCPTFHPSHVIRSEGRRGEYDPVLVRMFAEHLAAAAALPGRPWEKVPDYKSQVTVLENPRHAVSFIRDGFHRNKNPVTFDFETNCLKPDHPRSRIVCCAVSDGTATVAYPWHGEAITSTLNLLADSLVPKVGASIKFEYRWTLAKHGVRVRGFVHDTMLRAHALFNAAKTRRVTSVKFQAYALLGQGDYAGHISPFLKTDKDRGGYARNRIHEVSLREILVYCGLDALLEILIAKKQRRIGGK